MDGRMWEPQVETFAGRFRCLHPDLPGFGSAPLPPRAPSIQGQAEYLAGVLDEARVRRAVLCGFSMGGYIALAFAGLFPGRLDGLVLADTRAAADSEEAKAARTGTAERVLAQGVGFLAESMPEKLFSKTALESDPHLVHRVGEMMRSQPPGGVAAALLAMRDRPDRTAELPRIPCPTLVLCGAEDVLSPPREMRTMASSIPGARYAEIPGAGHLSNLENPGAFNRELTSFLREVAAADREAVE